MPYDLSARVQPVVDLIRHAALRGERCPTNAEIGASLRMRAGHVSSVITLACEQGLIAADSRRRGRVLRAADGAWRTGPVDPTNTTQDHAMPEYWTAARIAQLRTLWAAGHSAQQIARAMHTSKNAIVGKAHRLALPGRPSPIKTASTASRPARNPRRTLPPLAMSRATPGDMAACASTIEALHGPPGSNLGAVAAPLSRVRVQPGAVTAGTLVEVKFERVSKPCCWPMWGDWKHPHKDGRAPLPARFCDAPGIPGKPYCAEHRARAWSVAKQSQAA